MAQTIKENEYDEERWNFRPEVLRVLEDLRKQLESLQDTFCMITGDCCCGSCSSVQLSGEMDDTNKPFGLYWHTQDEEDLNDYGDGLYIGYLGNTDEEAVVAANIIIERLEDAGYKTAWGGDVSKRIYVKTPTLKVARG